MTQPPLVHSPSHGGGWPDMVAALRPVQWTKNLLVLAALAFAWGDRARPDHVASLAAIRTAVLAAAVFCALSSAIYIINDLFDLKADRAHPRKRFRPIAAGRVPLRRARLLAALLLLAAAAVSCTWLPVAFTGIAVLYIALQILYSAVLKQTALTDLLVIAAGFVLRAMAGAYAVQVDISPWLLLCTFFLALFLATCKRRHEKASLERNTPSQRPSLNSYSLALLDQLVAITAAATILAYAMYTLAPETVAKFGTQALGFTLPLVVFGLLRYLDLLYRRDKGDQPEMILLTDPPLLGTIVLYAATILAIFYFL